MFLKNDNHHNTNHFNNFSHTPYMVTSSLHNVLYSPNTYSQGHVACSTRFIWRTIRFTIAYHVIVLNFFKCIIFHLYMHSALQKKFWHENVRPFFIHCDELFRKQKQEDSTKLWLTNLKIKCLDGKYKWNTLL